MPYIPVVGRAILAKNVPEGIEYRKKGKRFFRSTFRLSEPTVSTHGEHVESYRFDVSFGGRQGVLELNYRLNGSDIVSLTTVYNGQAPAGYKTNHKNAHRNITLVETDKPERLDRNEGIGFF